METFNSFTAAIPTEIIPNPTEKTDLSDLDELLEESLALAPSKETTNKRLKATRKAVNTFIAEQRFVHWEVLKNIAVWTTTKCACGQQGSITFVKYMQYSERKKQSLETMWATVTELEEGVIPRHTLITRDVPMCECCCKINTLPNTLTFEDFSEVVK